MFEVQSVATQFTRRLRPIAERVAEKDPNLGDQLRRAGTSVLLNIAEGNQLKGGNRLAHFRRAAGSAAEASAALEIAQLWGYVDEAGTELDLLDRVRAMLWRLTH